jgi:hypothetical protein
MKVYWLALLVRPKNNEAGALTGASN